MSNRFKALCITGMTGTGKTDLALAVAKKLQGELICCDSTQMFKGLSVLTNQMDFSKEDVKTHQYECYNIEDSIDTNRWTNDSRKAIKDVLSRNSVPVLEGGSLFYHKQILKGFSLQDEEDNDHMKIARKEARDVVDKIYASDDDLFKRDWVEVANRVGMPHDIFESETMINDVYRLEQKIGMMLYLD